MFEVDDISRIGKALPFSSLFNAVESIEVNHSVGIFSHIHLDLRVILLHLHLQTKLSHTLYRENRLFHLDNGIDNLHIPSPHTKNSTLRLLILLHPLKVFYPVPNAPLFPLKNRVTCTNFHFPLDSRVLYMYFLRYKNVSSLILSSSSNSSPSISLSSSSCTISRINP